MNAPLHCLGLLTDVALMRLQGSVLEQRDGFWVQRTPANPTYHWGNCLILADAPEPGTLASWVETFRAEFPDAGHVAIGIDSETADLDPVEADALGIRIERDVVLTGRELAPTQRPAPDVECRVVDADSTAAWDALVELELREFGHADPTGHREFVERRFAGIRGLIRSGHGAWFAAYTPEGSAVSTMGIFTAGPGLARYQSVLTDPAFRRRGIAGELLRCAGSHGVDVLGAHTLVIVADPEGPAIGAYRAAGLRDHQQQWALYAAPS